MKSPLPLMYTDRSKNQNEALTDSIHVESNHISCYLFISSSLNSASLFGVCVCVCVRACVSVFMYVCERDTAEVEACIEMQA